MGWFALAINVMWLPEKRVCQPFPTVGQTAGPNAYLITPSLCDRMVRRILLALTEMVATAWDDMCKKGGQLLWVPESSLPGVGLRLNLSWWCREREKSAGGLCFSFKARHSFIPSIFIPSIWQQALICRTNKQICFQAEEHSQKSMGICWGPLCLVLYISTEPKSLTELRSYFSEL